MASKKHSKKRTNSKKEWKNKNKKKVDKNLRRHSKKKNEKKVYTEIESVESSQNVVVPEDTLTFDNPIVDAESVNDVEPASETEFVSETTPVSEVDSVDEAEHDSIAQPKAIGWRTATNAANASENTVSTDNNSTVENTTLLPVIDPLAPIIPLTVDKTLLDDALEILEQKNIINFANLIESVDFEEDIADVEEESLEYPDENLSPNNVSTEDLLPLEIPVEEGTEEGEVIVEVVVGLSEDDEEEKDVSQPTEEVQEEIQLVENNIEDESPEADVKSASSKFSILWIIGACLLLAGMVFVGYKLIPSKNNSSNTPWEDPNVQMGYSANKTPAEHQADLKVQVPDDSMITNVSSYVIIKPASTYCPNINLENIENNPCDQKFTLKVKDTGEVLYESGAVAPGQYISNIELSRSFDEGVYEAVVEIQGYKHDADMFGNHETIGQPVTLDVLIVVSEDEGEAYDIAKNQIG